MTQTQNLPIIKIYPENGLYYAHSQGCRLTNYGANTAEEAFDRAKVYAGSRQIVIL